MKPVIIGYDTFRGMDGDLKRVPIFSLRSKQTKQKANQLEAMKFIETETEIETWNPTPAQEKPISSVKLRGNRVSIDEVLRIEDGNEIVDEEEEVIRQPRFMDDIWSGRADRWMAVAR